MLLGDLGCPDLQVMSLLKEKKDELKAVQASGRDFLRSLCVDSREGRAGQDNVAQLLADFETARQKKDDLAVQVESFRI